MNKKFLKKLLVLNILLKLQASEIIEDDFTALQKLIKNHNGRIVRRLREADSCHLLDAEDNSLAHVAAKYGNLVALKQLKRAGLDLQAKNCHGLTPLHYAARGSNLDCLKYLLHKPEVKINETNNYGMTALHFAAKTGEPHCVDFLISKSADLNAQDERGLTPLHIASGRGWRHVVNSLVRNFADIELKDQRDLTAFELAVEKDHHSIAEDLALAQSKTEFRFDNLSDFNFYVTVQVALLGENPIHYVETLYDKIVTELGTHDIPVKKSVVLGWIHDLFAVRQGEVRQRQLALAQQPDVACSFGFDIGTGARSTQPCFVRAETESKMREIGVDPRVHGGEAEGRYQAVSILDSWRHWRCRMPAAEFLQTLAKGDRLLAGVDLPDDEVDEDLQVFLPKADAQQLLKDMGIKARLARQDIFSGRDLLQTAAKKNDSLPQKRSR
jgi:ankyrin repeat protein